MRLVVGLTGTIASGKEEVASLLAEEGYARFSLSDRVKDEAARRGFARPSREDLQAIGNEVRITSGASVWAEQTLALVESTAAAQAVVDGFRNPHEIAYFRQRTRFFLVAVDAPVDIRLKRLLERRRPGDVSSQEEFARLDAKD